MSLKERIYSILIVSATDNFTTAISGMFPDARYNPVDTISSVSLAKRILTERIYDFIIINSPLPDDNGIRFAIDISSNKQSVVLLLVKNDIYADIHAKVVGYGIFTLPKPTPKSTLSYALSWLESGRERLRLSEEKALSVEDKMTEIRLINKAKWILISNRGMNEDEAHHYIEKQAMDKCLSKKVIAEEIIASV